MTLSEPIKEEDDMNRTEPQRLSRRSVLTAMAGFAGAVAAAPLLQGCSSGASKPSSPAVAYAADSSGDIRYLCWEGYADQSFVAPYKGGTINPTYFGSLDEMFGKLRSGGGTAFDAVTTASDVVIPLAKAGLLAPIDVGSIPNYANLRPELSKSDLWNFEGKQYAVPVDWGSTVLLANTRTLGALEPTASFETLFDPKLKGRVTAMDDLSVIYTTAVYMGYPEFWALTDEQLAEVQKLLVDKLLPNVRKFSSTFADQANLFANKEVDLAWGWTGVIEKALQAVNVDYVTEHQITPAMPWYVDTISAVAGTKNAGGVGNWINYNLDPKVSALRFQVNGLPTVVPKAAEFLSPADQQLSYLTPSTSALWTNLDQKLQWRPVDRRSTYQQVWNSVKSGIREFSK